MKDKKNKIMIDFWNARYASKEYAYGVTPNQFFKESIDRFAGKGKILLPAEGEGRNAVYAAQQGFDVHAFDTSVEGQKKAYKLAQHHEVDINYTVDDITNIEHQPQSFDVIALVFAHFPPHIQKICHQKITKWLKPNGHLIFEGFSKNHLQMQKDYPKIGGPKKAEMLFSKEQIMDDLCNFNFMEIEEKIIHLSEGDFHIGKGSVVRFVARLNS